MSYAGSVDTSCGNEISLEKLKQQIIESAKYRGLPEDTSLYFLRVEYNGYDDVSEFALYCRYTKPNPAYNKLLAKYNENMKAYGEESVVFPEIKKLWRKWRDKIEAEEEIAQFNSLKTKLIKKGISVG